MKTKRYPTDLTDSQWFKIQHLIPAAKPGGRSRSLDMRLVVDVFLFGRHKHPTAGSIDSQTAKTGHRPASVRGYDGGKRITGRKRHFLVDMIGPMLAVLVSAADLPGRDGALQLLRRGCGFGQKLRLIWVDGAYRSSLQKWVAQRFRFRLRPVLRPQEQRGSSLLSVVGLWNAPSLGMASIGAYAKTMNDCRRVVSPLSISL